MTPAEIRDQLRFVMAGYSAAQSTRHPLVIQGMELIANNELQRLIPDKPTLAAVLGGQIAMRESLEADLAALDSTDSPA